MGKGIRVSKKGAFRNKTLKPGEKTPHGNMPDVFKIERIQEGDSEPIFRIVNKGGNWKGEIPISVAPPELLQLIADRSKVYIIAVPEATGLQPQSVIMGQDW